MLSWDDFRFVKAIADSRSLAGAATCLGVNHSTVFRRLGQIERQLGSRLFERGRAGYALTPSGEEMVELAERVGDDITSFERKVTGRDLRPSGELRVTTTDTILLHLLTGILIDFRRAYPEIVIDIVVSNAMLNLSKRDADVAVRASYQQADTPAGRCVSRIGWAVFGAKGMVEHPLDPSSDLTRYAWAAFGDANATGRASKWLKDRGVNENRIVYKVNTLLGLAEAVAGGVGLALLPCFIGHGLPMLAQLTSPLPEVQGELWLLTHPDLRNTARVRTFLDFCAGEFANRKSLIEGQAPVSQPLADFSARGRSV